MNSSTDNIWKITADDGQRQPHRLVALRLDELLDTTVGIVELVDHVLRIDVRAEVVVEEVDGVGDVGIGLRQQVGDLGADERAHCAGEDQERARARRAGS